MRELSTWSHSTYVFIAAGTTSPSPSFPMTKAHAYFHLDSGALINLPLSERTPEVISRITKLFDCLPSLFNQKRKLLRLPSNRVQCSKELKTDLCRFFFLAGIMGDPPTTELFIARKLAYYKAKHARWVVEGRVEAGTEFWHVIRVSPSSGTQRTLPTLHSTSLPLAD